MAALTEVTSKPGAVSQITEAEFLQVPDLTPQTLPTATWQILNLPDSWGKQSRSREVIGWYRLTVNFDASIATLPVPISLYIPRAANNIAVYVNGALLGVSGDIERQETSWNIAQYFELPLGLLRGGSNEILLRLHPAGFGRAGLSTVYIGDATPIRHMWEQRYFMQNTMPKFITVFVFLSGLLAVWIWAKRHAEAMFGLYALMCFVAAIRTAHYFIRDYSSPFASLAIPALGVLTALQLSFALRFSNDQSPRFERVVWIFIGITSVALFLVPERWEGLATAYYNYALGAIGIIILWVLVRKISRNFSIENLLMLFALVANAAFGIHDLCNYIGLLGFDRLYLLPLGLPLFVAGFCVILSMYGGGFATIPAYLRDMFGTINVGAIHGRLLLAWSAAAIVGPLLVNGFRDSQIRAGVPAAQAYSTTMNIMAVLLIAGFVTNLLVRPVAQKFWASEQRPGNLPGTSGADD